MKFEQIKREAEKLLAAERRNYQETLDRSLQVIYQIAHKSDGLESQKSLSKFMSHLVLSTAIPLVFLSKDTDRSKSQTSLIDRLNKTVSQFEQLQPAGFLSKGVSYLARIGHTTSSPRDTLKLILPNLFAKGDIRTIDAPLTDIFYAQTKILSTHLGVITALNMYEETFASEADQGHHFVMLSRHEVCTSLTKSFGLSGDSDLTALNPSMFDTGVQSRIELYATRKIKETMVDFMNQLYAKSVRVRAISSPVSRALSTATYAGLGAKLVDEFHVSHHFSEQKLGSRTPSLAFLSPYITSGTEGRTPEELSSALKKLNYKKITVSKFNRQDSIRSTAETTVEYRHRVGQAARELNLEHNPELNRITWVFAHGDLLKDLAKEVTAKKMPKLDYGDSYLMVEKDGTQKCVGIMNRFGRLKHNVKRVSESKAETGAEAQEVTHHQGAAESTPLRFEEKALGITPSTKKTSGASPITTSDLGLFSMPSSALPPESFSDDRTPVLDSPAR